MESLESTIFNFPKKPQLNDNLRRGKEVGLVSNFLKISFRPDEKGVRQYSIKYDPEIPDNNILMRKLVNRAIYQSLRKLYHPYVSSGNNFFSARNETEVVELLSEGTRDGEPFSYKVTLSPTNNFIDLSNVRSLDLSSKKIKNLIEIIVKNILNANEGMVRFDRRNYFDYRKKFKLPDSGIK